MGEQQSKVTIIAGRSGIVIEAGKKRRASVGWKVFAGAVVIIAVIAVATVIAVFDHNEAKHKAAVAKQKKLTQTVSDVNAYGDPTQLQSDSNALINGSKDGSYTVNNKQLAAAYAARGDVEFNAADYKTAVTDYDQAVKLDGSQQLLVGDNQFKARYFMGERKTLVPLLQTLQKPYKNNYNTGMQEHYEQYQSYIEDLQAGKELSL